MDNNWTPRKLKPAAVALVDSYAYPHWVNGMSYKYLSEGDVILIDEDKRDEGAKNQYCLEKHVLDGDRVAEKCYFDIRYLLGWRAIGYTNRDVLKPRS